MASSKISQIAGSALAGAVAFGVGFYAGLFIVLSIWGLEATSVVFVALTGGLGSLAAAGAIAWTVSAPRRSSAVVTAVALGVVLVCSVLVFDGDALALAIGGVVLTIVASTMVRTGMVDGWAR
jgi:hypothetical protein